MEEIGKILKERREELGFSINDIHERTKISPVKLNAIESGNISFFQHELSYLKFYIQYYAQSVHIPYEDIEDQVNSILDTFSDTLILKRDEQKKASNENIQKRMEKNKKQYKANNEYMKKSTKKRKIDFSSIALLILMVFIAALLVYGAVRIVLPMINPEPVVNVPEVPEVPNQPDPIDPEPEEPPVVVEPKEPLEVELTEVSHVPGSTLELNVNLNGIKDASFRIETGSTTWLQYTINGTPTSNPLDTIYQSGSSVELLLDPEVQDFVTLRVGTMINNHFFVDDTEIIIPEGSLNHNSGFTIKLNLIEEQQ